MYLNLTVDGVQFRGYAKNIIPALNAKGDEAERNEQNPHPYWQHAEYLTKEQFNDETKPRRRPTKKGTYRDNPRAGR